MIVLLKRRRQLKPVILWHDCNIPAKLFFDILNTRDYTKLGTAPIEELEKAFEKIFDEYVVLDGNEKVIQWYKKQCKISFLNYQIWVIETALYTICYAPLTKEQRIRVIDNLNAMQTPKVKFDKDKPILDEVQRIQRSVLGSIRNRLNLELSNEKKVEEQAKYSYRKDLAAIENVLGHSLPEKMSLEMFLERKKSAVEKSNNQRKLQRNGSKK